jgi:hypothetical protein
MAHRPVGAGSSFTFTAGAASTSSAFSVQSSVLRVVAVGGSAHVAIGLTPAATVTDYYISSGESATLALTKASNRVVGVTTGTTTVITVPEGTQVPYGVGDYVSLSVVGVQSYYNFTHQQVLSVNTTANYNGFFLTRMTVNYNSSGIITAFSASDATISYSNKISAIGAAGASGVIHFQQVQISGDA